MKRIAILIATTAGPVLVDRITPEPAPQSMVCLRRQSDVLPISADYDDFVRPGSGVIMREFGPYEEGAFRLDVSGPIGTGLSWQLGVFAAHAVFKSLSCELSDLDTADLIVWLTGTVDYDLNIGEVDHVAEKVESSALLLADYLSKGTPIIFAAAPNNAQFLADNKPPQGIEVVALHNARELLEKIGISQQPKTAGSKSFWVMAGAASVAVGAILAFLNLGMTDKAHKNEKPLVDDKIKVELTTDRGKNPIFFFGDDLNLIVQVSQKAWLNCFYRQVDGTIFQVYPNDQIDRVTSFEPDKAHILSGGASSPFVIRLGPPAGQEEVTCYASKKRMEIDPHSPPANIARDVLRFDLKP